MCEGGCVTVHVCVRANAQSKPTYIQSYNSPIFVHLFLIFTISIVNVCVTVNCTGISLETQVINV